MKSSNGVGLFAVPGAGKSLMTVSLCNLIKPKRTLILCPTSVVGVWPREFRKFSGLDFNVVDLRRTDRMSPLGVGKKAEMLVPALAKQDELDARSIDDFNSENHEDDFVGTVIVVNYESAWRDPLAQILLDTDWDFVVLDESHRIKTPNSKIGKFCHKLGKIATYKVALTGTEQPHSPLDVFSQYLFLNPSVFGSSFFQFKKRYAATNHWNTVVGYVNLDDLKEKIDSISIRINEEDADLDIPEAVHVTLDCELYHEAKRLHEEILDGMWVQLQEADGESAAVKASIVVAQLTRCAQVTGGHVGGVIDPNLPVEAQDPEVRRVKGSTKPQAVREILESIQGQSRGVDNDHKCVIFCRFQEDLAQIREIVESLGLSYGEVSGKEKTALNADAHMEESVDVAGVQIQAGGTGVDFTAARYVIYYNKDFSWGNYTQSLARAHRPGQNHRVTFYHLVAPDTIDERIEDSLQSKESVIDFFRKKYEVEYSPSKDQS